MAKKKDKDSSLAAIMLLIFVVAIYFYLIKYLWERISEKSETARSIGIVGIILFSASNILFFCGSEYYVLSSSVLVGGVLLYGYALFFADGKGIKIKPYLREYIDYLMSVKDAAVLDKETSLKILGLVEGETILFDSTSEDIEESYNLILKIIQNPDQYGLDGYLACSQKEYEEIAESSILKIRRAYEFLAPQNESQSTYEEATRSEAFSKEKAYKILRLEENASEEEIKKAYRSLSVQFHPDKFQYLDERGRQAATVLFTQIKDAYEFIKEENI